MNPNLSPMSTSGISLKDGQEVFFFHNKRKYILLTVSSSTPKEIIVNELIKERELSLK